MKKCCHKWIINAQNSQEVSNYSTAFEYKAQKSTWNAIKEYNAKMQHHKKRLKCMFLNILFSLHKMTHDNKKLACFMKIINKMFIIQPIGWEILKFMHNMINNIFRCYHVTRYLKTFHMDPATSLSLVIWTLINLNTAADKKSFYIRSF